MLILGSVPFLNVKPLIFPIEQKLVEHDFKLVYSPPSGLSELLDAGKIDLGLVPVAKLLTECGLRVVPNIAIASEGAVDSVVLLSSKPLGEIRNVAVDKASQSSAALLRVIMELFVGVKPDYVPKVVDSDFFDGVDAGMMIGDKGLLLRHNPPSGMTAYDLGEIWTRETGLPFVYGVYVVNRGVELGAGLGALERAKTIGMKMARMIASYEAPRLGLPEDICFRYMTERIRYDLGDTEIRGIMTYAEFLKQLGEIDEVFDLELYGAPSDSPKSSTGSPPENSPGGAKKASVASPNI